MQHTNLCEQCGGILVTKLPYCDAQDMKCPCFPHSKLNLVLSLGTDNAFLKYGCVTTYGLCFFRSQTVKWSQMVSNLLGFNLNLDAKTLPPLQKTYFLSSKTHESKKHLSIKIMAPNPWTKAPSHSPPKKSSPLVPVQRDFCM